MFLRVSAAVADARPEVLFRSLEGQIFTPSDLGVCALKSASPSGWTPSEVNSTFPQVNEPLPAHRSGHAIQAQPLPWQGRKP